MPPEPEDGAEHPTERTIVAAGTVGGRLLRAAERVHVLREQIEAARSRSRPVDVTLSVVERDAEIGGGLLAGAISYRLFVFLLPFAVFLVSGLGLYADATEQDVDDIAGDVGLTEIVAEQVAEAASNTARWWVLLVSLPILAYAVGQLYRATAIVHALAFTGSGRAVRLGPRSIGLFAAAAFGQVAIVNVVGSLRADTLVGTVVAALVAVVAVSALWLGVTALFPHGAATARDRLPGAILYGVGTLGVYLFNTFLIGWLVQSRADTYGALGAAAALLFSLYLTGRLVVGSAVLNAVLARRAGHVRNS